MHFDGWMLLFPIVLGIHNGEEYRRYENFVGSYHQRLRSRFVQRAAVLAAMILVTAASIALVALSYCYRTPTLHLFCKIAVFALMINALGHCALSILRHKLAAGTFSAIGLILPFSALALYAMHADLGDSVGTLARCAALGALAVPVIIVASLLGGFTCSHAVAALRQLGL